MEDIVVGVAARPTPGCPIDAVGIQVAPALLRRLGAAPGEVITFRSAAGKQVHSRVDESAADGSEDARLIRIGRMLWTQLMANPGDRLDLRRAGPLRPAEKVHVRPAFHLSHNLGHRLADRMRADAMVVWSGALLFATIFAGGGGVVVRIDQVDPETSGPAVAVPETEFLFEEPDPNVGRRRVTSAEIGGLDDAIRRLRDLIELPLLRPGLYRALGVRAPKGVLLYGPPGTGKTLLSRAVAEELGVTVKRLPATELVGTYSGETEANLRSLFNEASHHAPTIIVIDEIDVITTSRSRLASQSDIRATTQLLTLMDGLEEVDGVMLLATTNRVEAIDEAFRRPGRFDEEIYIGPPEVAARKEILAIHTREMPLAAGTEAVLAEIAEGPTAGFTGADLMHLVREAGLAAARRIVGRDAGVEIAEQVGASALAIEPDDVRRAVDTVQPSAMRGLPVVDSPLGWAEFVGVEDVQQALRHAAEAALAPGVGRRDGVLLSGPSGNGKSVLVQALAEAVGANFVLVDGSTVFTQWLGESEAALRALFRKARDVAPAVLVLEHLDAVAPRRVAGHIEAASSRVFAALLSCVDEALRRGGVMVVGITDRPQLIDPALRRSGRLGIHLEVGYPDDERRRRLIGPALGDVLPDEDIVRLVAETAGQSAADVQRRVLRELSHRRDG